MKTELQIAKRYIEDKDKLVEAPNKSECSLAFDCVMTSHKQSCRRFLEFLENLKKIKPITKYYKFQQVSYNQEVENKIKGLHDTIKFYKKCGI